MNFLFGPSHTHTHTHACDEHSCVSSYLRAESFLKLFWRRNSMEINSRKLIEFWEMFEYFWIFFKNYFQVIFVRVTQQMALIDGVAEMKHFSVAARGGGRISLKNYSVGCDWCAFGGCFICILHRQRGANSIYFTRPAPRGRVGKLLRVSCWLDFSCSATRRQL